MSRCVVAAAAFVMFAASPVFVTDARAQDGNSEPRLNFVSPSALPAWQPLELAAENTAQLPAEVGQFQAPALPAGVPIVQPYRRIETGQSPLLMSLYVSTAFTQALDIHSTLKALGRGGVETNPMLSGLTGNRGAFVAVKAAVAAGSNLRRQQAGQTQQGGGHRQHGRNQHRVRVRRVSQLQGRQPVAVARTPSHVDRTSSRSASPNPGTASRPDCDGRYTGADP